MISEKTKGVPYGISDFEKIRFKNKYFVDKTRFIPQLENHDYIFFIRPRRFGKSLWLSVLECYYDIRLKDRFDDYFKGTFIGERPTPEKNAHLILRFDFSMVDPAADNVEASFDKYCGRVFDHFIKVYGRLFDETVPKKIEQAASPSEKLDTLFMSAQGHDHKIYILIDEYDNFANVILSTAGTGAYHSLTHGEGFFRHFFAVLKGAAALRGSGLARLFITGVSPVTMDDVTSGFNIGTNISMETAFNEMTGFTEDDVLTMLHYYKKEGVFVPDITESIEIMRKWHNGYRFSNQNQPSLFNTDMVLYFMNISIMNRSVPRHLIDDNIKIDYGKLKHLMFVNRRLNGNFDILKTIMEQGEITSAIHPSFPLDRLTHPDNFISLLYFFGLLTFSGLRHGESLLAIPNMTVSHLMYGYIRDAYGDSDVFRINLWKFAGLVREMGWLGKWEEVFSFISEEIKTQTSIRDYLGGEKIIQGFLLAYMSINDFFMPYTEYESGKGYSDFFLEPFSAKYPEMPCGYLIEIKYVKRGEMTESVLKKATGEAKKQLAQYAQDPRFAEKYKDRTITRLALIYHGWELVAAREV